MNNSGQTETVEAKRKQGETETHEASGSEDQDQETPQGKDSSFSLKRPLVLLIVALGVILIATVALLYWLHARHYQKTDDAFIEGRITQIRPQVPGPIKALHIEDNQFVRQGDLLVEINPVHFEVALIEAKAQVENASGRLTQAQAQVEVAKASVSQAAAGVDSTRVVLENATRDYERYQAVDERARSQQQLDQVRSAQRKAAAQLARAEAQEISTKANLSASQAAVTAAEGEVAVANANVRKAEVDLSYCRITAPSDGRITRRTVEIGTYLQVGQAMFALVGTDIWVVANFKETQLEKMRPGQPVTVTVDAYPDLEFSGHIDSIQAGTGSRFSVLPAENASGNFVKIVQRVPVKILFDNTDKSAEVRLLAPGLSVVPKVKIF